MSRQACVCELSNNQELVWVSIAKEKEGKQIPIEKEKKEEKYKKKKSVR